MSDSVELNPVGAKQSADKAGEIYDRITGVISTLKAKTAAAGAPWGQDDAGNAFYLGSNGQPGYQSSGPQAVQGGESMGTFMSGYSQNQAQGAQYLQQVDAQNAAGFKP